MSQNHSVSKDTNSTQKPIFYVDAVAGAGKTFSASNHIKDNIDKFNFVVSSPSIRLLNQTYRHLANILPKNESGYLINNLVKIDSENSKRPVKDTLDFFENCKEPSGNILLITWKNYSSLEFIPGGMNWQAIVDEVPQVDSFSWFTLAKNYHFINDFLDIKEPFNDTLSLIRAKQKLIDSMREEAFKNYDDVTTFFMNLYKNVISKHYDVFVDNRSWDRVAERIESGEEINVETKDRIYFLSMIKPSIIQKNFDKVTIIGAHLKDSLLYHWFKEYHKINFYTNEDIQSGLRYQDHIELNKRIRIHYFFDQTPLSKSKRDSIVNKDTNTTYMTIIDGYLGRTLSNKPFLLVTNNDYIGPLKDHSMATQIPVISHGRNDLQEFQTIVFMTALNRMPKHINMLDSLGISSNDIRKATAFEVLYQNVMRTDLRKGQESNQIVDVYVPSIFDAKFLCEVFGDLEVHRVGDVNEPKKLKRLSQTEKDNRNKARQLQDQIFSGDDSEDWFLNTLSLETEKNREKYKTSGIQKSALPELVDSDGDQGQATTPILFLTFHKSIKDYKPGDFRTRKLTFKKFEELLRKSSKMVVESKDEINLVNPSIFDSSRKDADFEYVSHKTNETFVFSSMLILDFDDGKMSIQNFEDMFWNKAGRGTRRSFIIANSFSRSPEKPNRFRVFIPFTHAASKDQRDAVFYSYLNRIEEVFPDNTSGLDMASMNVTQSFWLPCTNRSHPEWRYFKSFGTSPKELLKLRVNPNNYFIHQAPETKVVYDVDNQQSNQKSSLTREQIESRIQTLKQELLSMSEGRHQTFFLFGVELKRKLRLDDAEVRMHLDEIERTIGKKGWTKSVMTSLLE